MNKNFDPNSNEILQKIISHYYDLESFSINNLNKELLFKLNSIFRSIKLLNLICFQNSYNNEDYYEKRIIFNLDMEIIKNDNINNYFMLIKYISIFGEESICFIKIIIHFYLYENEKINQNKLTLFQIDIKFINANDIFKLTEEKNNNNLKVNSFIELNGYIKAISNIKKKNTNVNFNCPFCGVIKNKKIYNKNIIKNENIHFCPNNNNNQINLNLEYNNPIYIRYLDIEINSETNNNNILAEIEENKFNINLLNKNVKFFGIIKTKKNNDNNNNFYIKYIKIIQIENFENFCLNNIYNNKDNENIISKLFNTFKEIKNKFSYFYNNLIPKIDYNNILLFYFLFSLSKNNSEYNIKINFIEMSCRNEISNLINIKRIFNKYPNLFKYIEYKKNNTIINFNELNNNEFINNDNNNFIINILDKIEKKNYKNSNHPNINNNYINFSYNNNYSNRCNIINNSNYNSSFIILSKNFDIDFSGSDIISLIHDINDKTNDIKKSNKIISEQFRNSNKLYKNYGNRVNFSLKMDETQYNPIDKITSIQKDIDLIDLMSINDYFKNLILCINEEKENNFSSILDYILFCNNYIFPKLSIENEKEIFFLCEHLKNQFNDLQTYNLFDINFICLNSIQKFSKLSARIEMRCYVNNNDILKGYLITKEFLQQNYVYYLVNRKGGKNIKKKKGKLNYVIEKLKQYSILKGKIIEKEEIKSFGLLNEEEYDDVIERLNTEGIILKVSKNEYEICV